MEVGKAAAGSPKKSGSSLNKGPPYEASYGAVTGAKPEADLNALDDIGAVTAGVAGTGVEAPMEARAADNMHA